ncbi:MAG: hypothetical protein ACI8QC_000673 [Planctomycetota bacterium]|jgi:hypothetical protein
MMRTPQNLLLAALFVLASCGADEGETPASTPVEPTGPNQELSSTISTTEGSPQQASPNTPEQDSASGQAPQVGPAAPADAGPAPEPQAPAVQAPSGRPGSAPLAEMRSLVPADAFLWVELDSFERASELLAELSQALGDLPIPPLDSVLDGLDAFGIASDQVRQNAPVGLALSMGIDDTPVPTFVVPVKNAASLAAKLQGAPGMPLPKTSGNAVAISLHESYKPNATHGALLSAGLAESPLSCRIHVEGLMQSFGTQIRQGLAMAKAMPQMTAGGTEASSLMSSQLDQTLRIFEETRFIGIAMDLRAGQLDVSFDLDLAADSSFITVPGNQATDLANLKSFVDENDAITILASLQQEHLDQFVQPMVDSFALATSSEQGSDLRQAYATFAEMIGSSGSSFGFTWHMDRGETDVVAVLQGIDTDATFKHARQLLGQQDLFAPLYEGTPPVSAGDENSRFLQFEFLPSAQALQDPEAADGLAFVEDVFGTQSMLLRMVAQGDQAILSMGQGASLARKAARTTPEASPELDWALGRIAGRSPAALVRIDLNRGMHGIARVRADGPSDKALSSGFELEQGIGEIPHLWLTSWSVFQPQHWSGGLRFDLGAAFSASQRASADLNPSAR